MTSWIILNIALQLSKILASNTFQSQKQLYNHKCLFMRLSVSKTHQQLEIIILHLSSFIFHPSSVILHHLSFLLQLLSFSACFLLLCNHFQCGLLLQQEHDL